MTDFDTIEDHREANDLYFGAPAVSAPDDLCELCGKPLANRDAAEFYATPDEADIRTLVAHRACGERHDLEEA